MVSKFFQNETHGVTKSIESMCVQWMDTNTYLVTAHFSSRVIPCRDAFAYTNSAPQYFSSAKWNAMCAFNKKRHASHSSLSTLTFHKYLRSAAYLEVM